MVENKSIIKVVPIRHSQEEPPNHLTVEGAAPHKWIGRIIIVELTTGSRIQGKVLSMSDEWVDTDNGAFRIANVVSAKWVSVEEAQIIRGGPLGSYPRQLPR